MPIPVHFSKAKNIKKLGKDKFSKGNLLDDYVGRRKRYTEMELPDKYAPDIWNPFDEKTNGYIRTMEWRSDRDGNKPGRVKTMEWMSGNDFPESDYYKEL